MAGRCRFAESIGMSAVGGHRSAVIRGTIWSTAQTVMSKGVSLAATVVLARLLVADDYGAANVAVSIGAALIMLPPFAMTDVLVADPEGFGRARRVAHRHSISAGVALAVVILVSAVLVGGPLGRPEVGALLLLVALRPVGDSIMIVPMSQLRIEMRFKEIAIVDSIASVLTSIGAVALAWLDLGPVALVAPPIVALFVRSVGYRQCLRSTGAGVSAPEMGVSRRIAREFRRAALGQYLNNFVVVAEPMVLACFASTTSQGYFALAFMLASQTNYLIASQIGLVLQPVFAKLNHDADRQFVAFIRSVRTISVVAIPACLVQIACAEIAIPIVVGDKWKPAIFPFIALCVAQIGVFIVGPTVALLKARGNFGVVLLWQFSHAAVATIGLPLAAIGGPRWLPMVLGGSQRGEGQPDPTVMAVCVASAAIWIASAAFGVYLASARSFSLTLNTGARLAAVSAAALIPSLAVRALLPSIVGKADQAWIVQFAIVAAASLAGLAVAIVLAAQTSSEGRSWSRRSVQRLLAGWRQ
jgi:O-antigen/teichoic acid export membrane protein